MNTLERKAVIEANYNISQVHNALNQLQDSFKVIPPVITPNKLNILINQLKSAQEWIEATLDDERTNLK